MGWVVMSERELNRVEVLAQVDDGRLTVDNAANMLCRCVWGDTFFLISAKSRATAKARLNCLVDFGSTRLRPGRASLRAAPRGNSRAEVQAGLATASWRLQYGTDCTYQT